MTRQEGQLFTLSRDELVHRARQGDQQAADELIRRGRDPKTGLKTSGLGASIGKAVANPRRRRTKRYGSLPARGHALGALRRDGMMEIEFKGERTTPDGPVYVYEAFDSWTLGRGGIQRMLVTVGRMNGSDRLEIRQTPISR